VNWFRKNSDGKFLWPGFEITAGHRMDVRSVFEVKARGAGRRRLVYLPNSSDLDLRGLNVARKTSELLRVDAEALEAGNSKDGEIFRAIRRKLPPRLSNQFAELRKRLG